MAKLRYLVPLSLFVPAFAAMILGGWWAWFLPVLVFGVVPLAEQLHPGTTANLTPDEEEAALSDRTYDWMIWAVVPLQVGLLVTFLFRLSAGGLAPAELVGLVATMGIACGSFGINVAHELGHRRTNHEQGMAKILLLTTLYQHFFVEHNRGHHRRVATPDDPASSRRGETVYGFWFRSITGSWRSAWELENARIARTDKPWWSWDNEMVRYTLYQATTVVVVGLLFGPVALGGFLVAALGGVLLLETVNYLEHYGLVRHRTERGTFERVRPHHSWNTNRPLGRVLLYDLTRHADHHANATRKFQVLRHFDDAPQLPAGYPGMIVLALVPPLFHAVMEPELERWETTYGPAADAAVAAK